METEFAYDQLPYSNHVFPATHPDKLYSAAKIFGLDSPNVENARVLEIGCGNGLNLISHAHSLPDANFVGVDLAKNHIEYAKKCVGELDLTNVEFRQIDLMQITAKEFGEFDYIIAHGFLSWIPEFVREKTFSVFSEMLKENGVGFLSYNTYPGWFYRRMVAEIGKFHTRHISNPSEKVEEAVKFIKFLGDQPNQKDVYKFILQNELFNYTNRGETAVFHDNLSDINIPFYFYQIAEMLDQNGFQFLSEAEFFSMSVQNLNEPARKMVGAIEDTIKRQQYLDFMVGRNFRQTLFCRKQFELNRNPDPKILDDFFVSSEIRTESEKPELHTDKIEKFIGLTDNKFEINNPLAKTALYHLQKILGDSIQFAELLSKAQIQLKSRNAEIRDFSEQTDITGEIFKHLILHTNLVQIHAYKSHIFTKIPDQPKINKFTQWQLKRGDLILADYEKHIKIREPLLRHLLEISDGSNNLEEIHKEMRNFIESGKFENKNVLLENLPIKIEENLERFARVGLFV